MVIIKGKSLLELEKLAYRLTSVWIDGSVPEEEVEQNQSTVGFELVRCNQLLYL